MSDETHGYLREVRSRIWSQIDDLRAGRLEAWDLAVQPRKSLNEERIAQYQEQLAVTEVLMRQYEVSFDA